MRSLLCPKLASQQLLYRTKISADLLLTVTEQITMQENNWGKASFWGMFVLFSLCVFCFGLQNRVQRKIDRWLFLHQEVWEFPNTEGGKEKAPTLNLSELKCSLHENGTQWRGINFTEAYAEIITVNKLTWVFIGWILRSLLPFISLSTRSCKGMLGSSKLHSL